MCGFIGVVSNGFFEQCDEEQALNNFLDIFKDTSAKQSSHPDPWKGLGKI